MKKSGQLYSHDTPTLTLKHQDLLMVVILIMNLQIIVLNSYINVRLKVAQIYFYWVETADLYLIHISNTLSILLIVHLYLYKICDGHCKNNNTLVPAGHEKRPKGMKQRVWETLPLYSLI